MTLRYLLDTNVVSEPLRPRPARGVLRRLGAHENQIAIPSVVWHELRFGADRLPVSRRREAIERYLKEIVFTTMPILPYDHAAAEWHATERARLASRGASPSFADGQIAAIARVNDLILVTFNAADFKRFEGIEVVSWA